MRLSKSWTTVTPFSRMIALILFIALPFIGFWIGYKAGIQNSNSQAIYPITSLMPSPVGMHCGGNIKNAATCPPSMRCQLGSNPDTGGSCVYKDD